MLQRWQNDWTSPKVPQSGFEKGETLCMVKVVDQISRVDGYSF